ncbi:YggS family pyridoxal phosphate-dependent enzyme [Ornithinibacillus halotolerans]|uniref:Pyridoxal phosphate homeostasis protein n=1 Tax=Ornithinibacillus halotolerans TaxID=1274357 RepID=A0A916S761_9BACI|nr:YggS family pyridoxal phosphate-dependent enzyme [Ornithinibacillus halotolerans]GGA84003.1 YggS family pyridoxal phosphate enzyme [Ornithinibacillus halotolerans]
MDVSTNLAEINAIIEESCQKVNRQPDEITIIAVTKYVTIDRTKEVIDAGIVNLGENRQEGFMEKYNSFKEQVNWHFIGSLQTRKVKDIIEKVDFIHSLDRLSLAKEINKRTTKTVGCFVQVNVSGEESKHGLDPKNVLSFIEEVAVYTNIRIVGLMTMAPYTDNKQLIHNVFRELRELRDTVKAKQFNHAPCEYLSMGMSNDFDIAIEEGATHIRIGSKLVGSNK